MNKDQISEKKYFEAGRFYVTYGIEKIDEIIDNLENKRIDKLDVNSVMELRNVSKVLDNPVYSDKVELEKYKKYSPKINKIFDDYLNKLTPDKLISDLKIVVVPYKVEFIEQVIIRKIYERIEVKDAYRFFDSLDCNLRVYLRFKNFVNYFSDEIKNRILSSNVFVEIFIAEKYCTSKKDKIFLPKLEDDEIRKALDRYINDAYASLHHLKKILYIREFNKFKTSQFDAKKRIERILNEIAKEGNSYPILIEQKTGKHLDNSVTVLDKRIVISYNTEYLEANHDYPSLLNYCIQYSGFVNLFTKLCNLVYSPSEDGITEMITEDRGNETYFRNCSFDIKEKVSNMQIAFFLGFLSSNDININDLIRWFFNIYISDEFGIKGFKVSISDDSKTYFTKCKDLVTLFDEIKKQYNIWVEYRRLDEGLAEMDTKSVSFKNIKSVNSEHYYYNESPDMDEESRMLFSSQSTLFYIEKFDRHNYNSLYDLLSNENVSLEDFYPYQIEGIKWLLQRNVLQLADGYVKLNQNKAFLLKLIYKDGVIVLTRFNKEAIIEIFNGEKCRIENTLLSESEAAYFDYYLNDTYTNGMHIRNKYSHPPTSNDEVICKNDYYHIIKLIIILIIKINDDLCTYYGKGIG